MRKYKNIQYYSGILHHINYNYQNIHTYTIQKNMHSHILHMHYYIYVLNKQYYNSNAAYKYFRTNIHKNNVIRYKNS